MCVYIIWEYRWDPFRLKSFSLEATSYATGVSMGEVVCTIVSTASGYFGGQHDQLASLEATSYVTGVFMRQFVQ